MIDDFNLAILSGGHYVCDPTWDRDASASDRCYKVYFPVAGSGRVAMGAEWFPLEPGRIYFVSGYRLTRQECPERMEVYWLHFVPESLYLRYLLDQVPAVCAWPQQQAGWPTGSYREICELFDDPSKERNRLRGDSPLAVTCRIHGLLLGLISRVLRLEEASGEVGGLAEYQRLLPGIDYMQRHYREDPPLAAIAHAAGLAPNYFHRRFKRLFGQTPRDHMLAQRMNRARHLLTNTSRTIKEIAAHCGYEDPAHFSRVFAAQFGCPASLYRTQRC